MSIMNYKEAKEHLGHKIVCAAYEKERVYFKCEDCNEVIVDYDK